MEGEDELSDFRKRWKQELEHKTVGYCSRAERTERRSGRASAPESGRKRLEEGCREQPEYVSIAEGLLDGRSSPLLARMEEERMRRKRRCERGAEPEEQLLSAAQSPSGAHLTLIDQFIQDLVGLSLKHIKQP